MKNTFRQKKTSSGILFSLIFLFLFLTSFLKCQTTTVQGDTAFINDLVKFYQSRCGNILKGELYKNSAVLDSPYVYVYVSPRNKVENSLKNVGYFLFCKYDLKKAQHYDSVYSDVNDCFIYTTAANATTRLSAELLSYRKESQAFIVFHELTHVLLSNLKSKITYTVSESVCDMVANYMTREYAVTKKTLNLRTVEAQILLNEHLYTLFNQTIQKINSNPNQKQAAISFAEKDIKRTLVKADEFQKRRFDYKVNNAYLLKNSFYSENYFEYKQEFISNKMLPADLKVIARK